MITEIVSDCIAYDIGNWPIYPNNNFVLKKNACLGQLRIATGVIAIGISMYIVAVVQHLKEQARGVLVMTLLKLL